MKKVYAKHLPYDDGHLGKVYHDMLVAGPPTIRVMQLDDKDEFYALEGSHRLALAHQLGIILKLVIEIEEKEHLPLEHWFKVAKSLPYYQFQSCYVLDLKNVKQKV
jgi:hypothetical protein